MALGLPKRNFLQKKIVKAAGGITSDPSMIKVPGAGRTMKAIKAVEQVKANLVPSKKLRAKWPKGGTYER